MQVNMTQYNCRIEVFVNKHFCSKPPASTSTVLLPQRLPSAAEVNQMCMCSQEQDQHCRMGFAYRVHRMAPLTPLELPPGAVTQLFSI